VIYHDHDWNLEARQQSEDRAHRIGQTNHVTYFDLVAKDTVDEVIIDSLKAKLSLADAVTGDGWRRLFKLPT
jgi:SNF2 family DNA or RNA helicase